MVDIVYKKGVLKMEHIWFCKVKPNNRNKNIVFYHNVFDKSMCDNNLSKEILKQYSLVTDLTKDKDEIYKNIRKNIRYEIRKCQKLDVRYQSYLGQDIEKQPELLSQFKKVYEEMYREKGMKVKFNLKQIKEYININAVVFTIAFYDNSPMVFHSYIIDEDNARFYYSASLFRNSHFDANLIAIMNKGLHWFDIELFKNQNKKTYDWGGISNFDNPNGIDYFKMGFGGEKITYYNIIEYHGMLGDLCYKIRKLRG